MTTKNQTKKAAKKCPDCVMLSEDALPSFLNVCPLCAAERRLASKAGGK